MDTARLIAAVCSESQRFTAALQGAELGRTVPTCPDWNGYDLAWHLAEVQLFWGAVVERLIEDPAQEYDQPERPPDDEVLDLGRAISAELVAGLDITTPEVEFAADGVDEVLSVMFGGLPAWATFIPDGEALTLVATDADQRWTVEFGRFGGQSPASGRTHDLDDARVVEVRPTQTTISGRAWDLDRWLWGRVDEGSLRIDGEVSLAGRLRAVAAESTQ